MNKKIIFLSESKEKFYCILSAKKDIDAQLNLLIWGEEDPRHGICICFSGDTIDYVDYYHNEKIASFRVIGIEETEEALSTSFLNR